MTLSIMKLSITTLSMMELSITILTIMSLSIMTLSITTLSIMIFSIKALNKKTYFEPAYLGKKDNKIAEAKISQKCCLYFGLIHFYNKIT